MRILGADSFVGRTTSINAIPRSVLKKHDLCIVKIDNEGVDYVPAIYFMEYITNDGNPENIPYVVVPIDNQDMNVIEGVTTDDGGRWRLKSIFAQSLTVDTLYTNNISSVAGVPFVLGESLTVTSDGIIVDGQVVIEAPIDEPPMIVSSNVMVENLNAEYLNGYEPRHFLLNKNFEVAIPNGVEYLDVYFTHAVTTPPHYSVMVDICNLVDPDPAIYSFVITKKEYNHFRVRFSGIIDGENYVLHYFVVGDTDPSIFPPPPSATPGPSGWPWPPSGWPSPSGVWPPSGMWPPSGGILPPSGV